MSRALAFFLYPGMDESGVGGGGLSSASVFFFFPCLLRATPETYGGSQARGPVRDIATGLHNTHSSQQRWILNPLGKARDQTCALLDTSQVR